MFAPRLIAEAFLVATAAPAVLFALMAPSWFMFLAALVVAGAHTMLVGVPFVVGLHLRGWVNAFTSIGGGFVVGLIPTAVWTWVLSPIQAPDYRGVLLMGAFGAFAGLWFWLYLWVRQALAATPTGHETPVPPSPQ